MKSKTTQTDLKDIKSMLLALNEKINMLLEDKEAQSAMLLTEKTLKPFLQNEPDLYNANDVKVRYNLFSHKLKC